MWGVAAEVGNESAQLATDDLETDALLAGPSGGAADPGLPQLQNHFVWFLTNL